MFNKLKQGLVKTRGRLSKGLKSLLQGRNEVDKKLLEDIELQLLSSDVGVDATNEILEKLESRAKSQSISESSEDSRDSSTIGSVEDIMKAISSSSNRNRISTKFPCSL